MEPAFIWATTFGIPTVMASISTPGDPDFHGAWAGEPPGIIEVLTGATDTEDIMQDTIAAIIMVFMMDTTTRTIITATIATPNITDTDHPAVEPQMAIMLAMAEETDHSVNNTNRNMEPAEWHAL